MQAHTHTQQRSHMYSIHTHSGKLEKREWGSCENIASRYLKRVERKYGAIFYSFQPVRVSKASPVQWTFTVHANTHTEMHTQTHIELLNQNPGVTEWVVNICLLLDLKQLVDYSCVRAIFFFLSSQASPWPNSHSNTNKWFHVGKPYHCSVSAPGRS